MAMTECVGSGQVQMINKPEVEQFRYVVLTLARFPEISVLKGKQETALFSFLERRDVGFKSNQIWQVFDISTCGRSLQDFN